MSKPPLALGCTPPPKIRSTLSSGIPPRPLLPSKKTKTAPHLASGSSPRPTAVSTQPRGIARPSSCRLSSAASAAAAAAAAELPLLLPPAAAAVAAADAAAAGLGGPKAASGIPSSCSQVQCCASLHTYTHTHTQINTQNQLQSLSSVLSSPPSDSSVPTLSRCVRCRMKPGQGKMTRTHAHITPV